MARMNACPAEAIQTGMRTDFMLLRSILEI
jgi:hypothetical protein